MSHEEVIVAVTDGVKVDVGVEVAEAVVSVGQPGPVGPQGPIGEPGGEFLFGYWYVQKDEQFSARMNYSTPNNAATPDAGGIVHASKARDELRISKTDDDGNTIAPENILAEDTLTIGTQSWVATADATDSGTYATVPVSPAVQTSPDGVTDFSVLRPLPPGPPPSGQVSGDADVGIYLSYIDRDGIDREEAFNAFTQIGDFLRVQRESGETATATITSFEKNVGAPGHWLIGVEAGTSLPTANERVQVAVITSPENSRTGDIDDAIRP